MKYVQACSFLHGDVFLRGDFHSSNHAHIADDASTTGFLS